MIGGAAVMKSATAELQAAASDELSHLYNSHTPGTYHQHWQGSTVFTLQ